MDQEKREYLGKEVRKEWVRKATELENPKPAHLLPWAELDEWNKEVDRCIGEHIAQVVTHDYAQLQEAVKALHNALNDVLPLFVRYEGWDYSCVDDALKALVLHPELGVTMALSQKIRELGYDKENER